MVLIYQSPLTRSSWALACGGSCTSARHMRCLCWTAKRTPYASVVLLLPKPPVKQHPKSCICQQLLEAHLQDTTAKDLQPCSVWSVLLIGLLVKATIMISSDAWLVLLDLDAWISWKMLCALSYLPSCSWIPTRIGQFKTKYRPCWHQSAMLTTETHTTTPVLHSVACCSQIMSRPPVLGNFWS